MAALSGRALRLVASAMLGLCAAAAPAEVRLAGVFGDHMVLQRNAPIRVWGTAAPGEAVRVSLGGRQRHAVAGNDGRWSLQLPAMPAGGPHQLTVNAGKRLVLEDVLVGDVWFCSGQSNMEWTLAQAQDAEREIAAADLPQIRHLKVAHRASLAAQDDIEPAAWLVGDPQHAGQFSAVAYYFARRLHRELGVPIGLVNASWGGSHIETWTSARAALADPELAPIVRGMPADAAQFAARQHARMHAIVRQWQGNLPLWASPVAPDWAAADIDEGAWPELNAPQIWEEQGLPGFDGTLWYRRRIELSAEQAAGAATLHLGMIDDCDETWVNGRRVGATCGWDTPRHYELPAGALRGGSNVIAVRVLDTGGGGGFHGDAAAMALDTATAPLPLHGRWKARVEAPLAKTGPDFNDLPTLLFNGMVQPLTPLRVRGVIWYQGESNVPRAARYADAMRRLISDWRQQWAQPGLPFFYVQLAAFLPLSRNSLAGSAWAELREAQRQVSSVHGTGMVVATDVGDANDIHPRNKAPVGERLALLALHQLDGRKLVHSGPSYRSMRRLPRGRLELSFGDLGGGLAVREAGGALQGFAVADASRRFVPAQAVIQGTRVIVWSDGVPLAQAVRYGWVDNPEQSNLVNRVGLPASPFRTDRWPLLTQDAKPEF